MLRGIYTGAAGMVVQQNRLDAISNNLANVDTTGYKRDTAIQKAFPELLLRRMSDDGVTQFPYRHPVVGSFDSAAVVGSIGTGVETNEVFTAFTQGGLRQTENSFDLALDGDGFFVVQTPYGERYTRNGSFLIGSEGMLVTKQGYPVLGENGPIQLKLNNFVVNEDGVIYENTDFADDPRRLVSMRENEWLNTVEVDRLQIVQVRQPRYLQKQGDSFWRTTEESGEAAIVTAGRPKVRQGFLEGSNVNPVTEMVQMIEVNRAYEANQKVIQAQDQATSRLINEAMRLR
ncbi:MAG: flagellar basal-body rod protein FlgF [Spirochaetales bacterium]|nr:flagellar basal-body rod protein FlgF [Spirochaetales bacterium]